LRVIAIANQKGGCGKTTTSINFAACLASLQKKTLLLDLDPQGHSTCGLGIKSSNYPTSLYDFLTPLRLSKPDFSKALCEMNPYFYVMPTYGILGALEEELMMMPDKEERLKSLLISPACLPLEFDYVVIDCPPNLGLLSLSALEAADEIIIPIEPSFFSLHGLAKISETVAGFNQRRERPLQTHALLTLFNSETKFAEEVYEEVKAHFKDQLFSAIIHENVLLKEAASAGQSIVDYARNSNAYRDYVHMATEYLEKQWDRMLPPQKLGWENVLRHHYGPKRVPGGVLFQLASKNARWVEIAGDFNNWIPEALVRRSEDGLWQKVIPMPTGHFRYKYIIDGEWQIDPYQPTQQLNAFGTFDSYLELA
jgi:chromosome partitioning protein